MLNRQFYRDLTYIYVCLGFYIVSKDPKTIDGCFEYSDTDKDIRNTIYVH